MYGYVPLYLAELKLEPDGHDHPKRGLFTTIP